MLKIIEAKYYDNNDETLTVENAKDSFKKYCNQNNLKTLYKNDTDLLNFILFPKESMEFYNKSSVLSMNDLIKLQEGFGFYMSD